LWNPQFPWTREFWIIILPNPVAQMVEPFKVQINPNLVPWGNQGQYNIFWESCKAPQFQKSLITLGFPWWFLKDKFAQEIWVPLGLEKFLGQFGSFPNPLWPKNGGKFPPKEVPNLGLP